jgi:hypothetical protein
MKLFAWKENSCHCLMLSTFLDSDFCSMVPIARPELKRITGFRIKDGKYAALQLISEDPEHAVEQHKTICSLMQNIEILFIENWMRPHCMRLMTHVP